MKNNKNMQLAFNLSELEFYNYCSFGTVNTRNIKNFPFLIWPNYFPCHLANSYITSILMRPTRLGRSLSTRGPKGGTLGSYAGNISHLIRYCFLHKRDFIEIDDRFFTEFISALRSQKHSETSFKPRRTEKTITTIGRRCLDFLTFVGNFYSQSNFVSKDGIIRAFEQEYLVTSNGRKFKRYYLTHHSFSNADSKSRRDPITKESITRLREAVDACEKSRFIQQRRHCLISLLEFTGARIGELAELKVEDILRADSMAEPSLKLINLKQEEGAYRYVPVTKLLINELKKHIKTFRYKVIKDTCGSKADHGFFFVSERNGKQLASGTLSKEVADLRIIAKISEKACAHMFRHAFCTNLFVLLINRHEIENPDSFRRMLLDSETFKIEVMQWTGHKRLSSLDHYINLAFAECANYGKTISSVQLILAHENFDRQLSALMKKHEFGMPFNQFQHEMSELIRLRDLDFAIAKSHDS